MNLAKDLEPEIPAEELTEAPAEAAEPPKEEPKEEPKAEEKPEEKKQTLVPHGALHEERKRRQQAERELTELRQNQAVLNDRFNQLYQAVGQQQQPQFRDPDKDPDPLEAMKHNQALLAQQIAAQQQHMSEQNARAQYAAQEQKLIEWGSSLANEFRQEAPDFDDAYNHIRMLRAGELQAMGLSGPRLIAALKQDEFNVIAAAAQQGRNPAEIVYAMAQAAGYKKKEDKPKPEEKVEQLNKGVQAAKNLGSGGAAAGMPTPEQIADMPEEEFEELKAKLRSKGKRISDVI